MADRRAFYPGDSSAESVAVKLADEIGQAELHYGVIDERTRNSREYILDLFAECLRATKGQRKPHH